MAEREQRLRARDAELSRARAAVLPRAKGQPASAIRQLLIGQLRSQGSDVPPDDMLDMQVKRVQHALPLVPPPGAGLFASARALASAYRQHRSVVAEIRSAMQPTERETLAGPHGERPYVSFSGTDQSLPMVQVTADQQALTQLAPPGGEVFVSLLSQTDSEADRVTAFIGERQVGVLRADDGALYQPAMAAARAKGAVLMVKGVIESPSDGKKQLRIYPAGIL